MDKASGVMDALNNKDFSGSLISLLENGDFLPSFLNLSKILNLNYKGNDKSGRVWRRRKRGNGSNRNGTVLRNTVKIYKTNETDNVPQPRRKRE